jgi:hypothetical protein
LLADQALTLKAVGINERKRDLPAMQGDVEIDNCLPIKKAKPISIKVLTGSTPMYVLAVPTIVLSNRGFTGYAS